MADDGPRIEQVQPEYSLTRVADLWVIHTTANGVSALGDEVNGWFAWLPSGETAKGRELGKKGCAAALRALTGGAVSLLVTHDDERASGDAVERR